MSKNPKKRKSHLRIARIALASLVFTAFVVLLLDIGGLFHGVLGFLPKLEFWPAVLALNIVVVLLIVVVTVLFGRWYCSVLCPLGILQDGEYRIRTLGKKKNRFRQSWSQPKNWLRYSILAAFILASALAPGAIAALVEPYSIFGRMIASIRGTFAANPGGSWVMAVTISAVTFALITFLVVRGGRTWCNTICPVGSLLSIFSRWSLWRPVIDTSKCTHCGSCAKACRASCIDSANQKVDTSRCTLCLDCLDNCSSGAIRYALSLPGSGISGTKPTQSVPTEAQTPVSGTKTPISVPTEAKTPVSGTKTPISVPTEAKTPVSGTKPPISVPTEAKTPVLGTKTPISVPTEAKTPVSGTKPPISVPTEAKTSVSGTKPAQSVPTEAKTPVSGTKPTQSVPGPEGDAPQKDISEGETLPFSGASPSGGNSNGQNSDKPANTSRRRFLGVGAIAALTLSQSRAEAKALRVLPAIKASTKAGAITKAGASTKASNKAPRVLPPLEAKIAPSRKVPVVPPGAGSLKHFTAHCIACHLCVDACPSHLLTPAVTLDNFLQPLMNFENGFCRPECTVCSQVCPTSAISPITPEQKTAISIGHAVYHRDRCVVITDEVSCGNCAVHCPTGAITMIKFGERRIPSISYERCIGCGRCEYVCPARPESAIHIEGNEIHREI